MPRVVADPLAETAMCDEREMAAGADEGEETDHISDLRRPVGDTGLEPMTSAV